MSRIRRGYRYQATGYSLKGVWLVLDTWRGTGHLHPTVFTSYTRREARTMAKLLNQQELNGNQDLLTLPEEKANR